MRGSTEGWGVGVEIGEVIDSTDTSLLRQDATQSSNNSAGFAIREEGRLNVLTPSISSRAWRAFLHPSSFRPDHEAVAAGSQGLGVR